MANLSKTEYLNSNTREAIISKKVAELTTGYYFHIFLLTLVKKFTAIFIPREIRMEIITFLINLDCRKYQLQICHFLNQGSQGSKGSQGSQGSQENYTRLDKK